MTFLDKYDVPKNVRFDSFKYALEEASKRNLKVFVELGVARGKKKFFFILKPNWKDGMSTLIFSEYAKNMGGHLYACDISKESIRNAKNFTSKFKDYVTFYEGDSVAFIKSFQKKVDFLYLDSLDSPQHQLDEIKNSVEILHKNSLVLLDDKEQKAKLSLDYMLDNEFVIINETQEQVLLSFQ